MLGSLMFLLCINDIGENTKAQISLFVDDAVLYGVIKDCDDAESLQQDVNTLVQWADTWQMSFNAKKCTILCRCHARNLQLNINASSMKNPWMQLITTNTLESSYLVI